MARGKYLLCYPGFDVENVSVTGPTGSVEVPWHQGIIPAKRYVENRTSVCGEST